MPLQNALPTWLALNNMNSSSPSGNTDPNTGFPYQGGGLNPGDYFDVTNDEAANASYTTNGTLFAGRYRYVAVDSGATAANVKTGTIGYLRQGLQVKSVVITSAGSGQTNGTYQIAANAGSGGSGTGAIITVVIAGGAITSATVNQPGQNYSLVPTFTVSEGGSSGTVVAQLGTSMNLVTSYDQVAAGTAVAVRPVVFLNSITPGNYGFIQELGVATVLSSGAISVANYANATTSGQVVSGGTTAGPSNVGLTVEPAATGLLSKVVLIGPTVQD